jgi:hypothetical protein
LKSVKTLPVTGGTTYKSVAIDPYIYLCKVHKEELKEDGQKTAPFRPILSSIGTCTYKLAKFFVPLLKQHTINEFSVNDSFSLADNIREQNGSLYMTSFDISSLFTNIPLDETIEICVNTVFHRKKKVKGLLKRQFKALLTHATKSSCFLFNGIYYYQVDGVAMGSPLGPTLANAFLCHHEIVWLNNCPPQFKPVYYKRYVDDIIVFFKDKKHVKKFLRYLNSRHPNITFTIEEEENDRLPFLDIEIRRENGKLVTSVYKKNTFSGVYLNFDSYLPKQYKQGLIYSLLFRAFKICSDKIKFRKEIEKLTTILKKNSFPCFFINRCIKLCLDKLFTKRPSETSTSQKKELRIVLPFLGKVSLQVKRRLRNIYKLYLPNVKLNVIFSSKRRLNNSFCYKDRIPMDINSLILYNFTCSICKDTYLGKTKRHFLVREYEHLGLSVATNKSLKFNSSNASDIRKHLHTCGHTSSLEDFKIVGNASNDYHLRIKESLLISKYKPPLNITKRSIPLFLFDD